MRRQLECLSMIGLLSRFVGMLTDSRSFISYPRHEYFRRILCDILGSDIETGRIPASEIYRVEQMMEDISYATPAHTSDSGRQKRLRRGTKRGREAPGTSLPY